MKKLLALLTVFAFVLAACSTGAQAGGDPTQENQTEIERNKEKWQDANITHYRFNLTSVASVYLPRICRSS